MKKNIPALMALALSGILWSCSDNNTSGTGTETTETTTSTTSTGTTDTSNMTNANSNTVNAGAGGATAYSNTPLGREDSAFVMKAAMGGMMEVEAGNLAKQNATSERVKNFANMMVNDHTKANQELMSLASSKGMTLPQTMSAEMQRHVEALRKAQGKNFDRQYMSMMVTDHRKDVSEFQKQSTSGTDADLKSWAGKTLPVLQMHRDSAEAINKIKF